MDTIFLGLHTRNLGTRTRQAINPFTGESLTGYIDNGMTSAEKAAASALLQDAGASEPDDDGFRIVRFSGSTCAHVCLGDIGGEIDIPADVTREVASFVFQLAMAAGMLVTSTIDPEVIAVLPGQDHSGIGIRWPHAVQVDSAESLLAWINAEQANGRIV